MYASRPTLRAVDAAGAARNLSAIYAAVACRRSVPFMEVASGATDAVRWAVQSMRGADKNTRIRKRVSTTFV